MAKQLVIVESPAKARTIESFLGSDYLVKATYGHVRDLPSKELGIDIDDRFTPHYITIPRAKRTIAELKKHLIGVKSVYLATDFDREGEAIAWHVTQAFGLGNPKSHVPNPKIHRITFHEITKAALTEAVKNPRELNMDLVDAQQARRILDRLVGYKLSPFLWKKVLGGLSAGRVQSVAVRLIVDREQEIANFQSKEYWTLIATLSPAGKESDQFEATLAKVNGQTLDKFAISSSKEAQKYQAIFGQADYQVLVVSHSEQKKYPFPPFTTSTLQQDANRRLGNTSKKTMRIAQDLYEAGKITYMRTDSTNLSWLAINTARKYIESKFGRAYLPEKPRLYKTKTLAAQEAHEAIRPTYIETENLTGNRFTEDHQKLYQLIRNRLLACQAAEAVLDVTRIEVKAQTKDSSVKDGLFVATGQVVRFDGFTKIYPISIEQTTLPRVMERQLVNLMDLQPKQHFTKPPDRYSEATLVKALEEHGIGRPSTYSPIISTIQDRGYVYLQQRFFYPREIGQIVTDLLVKHFPDIMDIGFTAEMEENLDAIAHGQKAWVGVIKTFYDPFAKNLAQKTVEVEKVSFKEDEAGEVCPKCGKPMVVKVSRYGKFLACSGYPGCKTTKYLAQSTGLKCPDCREGEVVERFTKHRKIFWGCSRYPECKFASWVKPTGNAVNNVAPSQK